MLAINAFAILFLVAMFFMYKPICNYLRAKVITVASTRSTAGRHNTKGNQKKKNQKSSKNYFNSEIVSPEQEKAIGFTSFVVVMVIAFLARILTVVILALKGYKGYETDMNCFLLWGDMVYNDGLKGFYLSESFHDYPPGYMYILYIIGTLRHIFGISWDSITSVLMTKLPPILADMGIGYMVYKVASEKFKERGAALLSALILFCPPIFLDSTVWGQTDSVYTFLIILMCYMITKEKLIPAYFIFAVAILIKPQSLLFGPVLVFAIIDQIFLKDYDTKKMLKNLAFGIAAIGCIFLLMLPYGFKAALSQYTDTLGSYEYASVNAYNLWTLLGKNWAAQSDKALGITYQSWGTIFIILTIIGVAYINFKCKNSKSKYYFMSALTVTCVFALSVRMHERYMFPAIALLIMAYIVRPRKQMYVLFGLAATAAFYNMAHVLFYYDPSKYDSSNPAFYVISALVMFMLGYMIYVAVKYFTKPVIETVETESMKVIAAGAGGRGSTDGKPRICPSDTLAKMVKTDFIMMGLITAIYAVVAFANLGNMSAPVTTYSVVKQGAITLDFGKDVSVTKMWDFLGYQNNPHYIVEYTSDANGTWTTLYGEGNVWDAGGVFCWNEKDMNITARYIRISAASDNSNDSLQELVFTDASGKLIEPVNIENYSTLFDEQDLFTGRASNKNGSYFDEIYHARTAYEMIHHLYCYENTHPPLGKEFIALGVLIFGMNPFGWRFMGTLFGVLMLPIIYNFAKKLFKETWLASVTTILFAFDFMHFVQTRIATIDVFVTLFIMLSYYFMYCYSRLNFYDTPLKKTFIPLGLCGIAMGLGWASKWTGIYSSAGLAVILFAQFIKRFREYIYASSNPKGKTGDISHEYVVKNFHKLILKTIGFCCIFFVVVPVAIYLLSYIPFNDGSDRTFIAKVINAQKTMYEYHSNLNATHPYSSKWYQWPIMYRPMWYYSSVINDTLREGISAFGNPLVWWAGIPASLFMIYWMIRKKDKNAAFLLVGYLSQYAPWFLVTRVVFIYHYFPSVPFVTIMVAYCLGLMAKWKPKMKYFAFGYCVAAIILFCMFYPVLSGTPTTVSYVEHFLKWSKNWVLLQTW